MRLLPLIAALALASCVTSRTGAGLERNWARAYGAREAQFTLSGGRQIWMNHPQDFGMAVCGEDDGCVRKSEIGSVRWFTGSGIDPVEETLAFGVYLVLAPFALATQATRTRPPPSNDASDPDTEWLQYEFHCTKEASPSYVGRQFRTDAEFAEWVYERRFGISALCLRSASRPLRAIDRTRALELRTLGDIRWRWDLLRCAHEPVSRMPPIVSTAGFGLDLTRGDPAFFAILNALWVDPRTWAHDQALTAECADAGGVADPAAWPQRREMMETFRPFGRGLHMHLPVPTLDHRVKSRRPQG